MIANKMKPYLQNNSAIRAMFEEGKKMAAVYGADQVYDFSLGNPNVPAPAQIKDAIIRILNEEDSVFVHGYMSNAGYPHVREKIAENLNCRFGTAFKAENLIMTVGAGSGLNVCLKTLLDPGDEVIVFAPYFVEYGSYIRNYDGVLVQIDPDIPGFQLNLADFEKKITAKTKAVIINNPHNPTGVVYSEETIQKLAEIMQKKQQEYGHAIYLLSDEPYRELAFDGVEVPFVTKYYENTLVVYSYSKSLSLPGERIGYVIIPDEVEDSGDTIAAATIANRIGGCVNAPSLMQLAVAECVDAEVDLGYYDRNRKTLYEGLNRLGFTCVKPDGAFYLWMKSPAEDEKQFIETAKKYHILMVPGSSFACPGYVRLAYCVSYEKILSAMPAFEKLAKEYFS